MPAARTPPPRVAPTPTPHEAAAIAASIERFRADTAPPPTALAPRASPWLRAALLEGTGRDADAWSPWVDRAAGG